VIAQRLDPAVFPKADPKADEVIAQRLDPAVFPKPHPRFDVVFDPTKQAYKIT
jgi:hypothetical protein